MGASRHTPGTWVSEDRGGRVVILAEGYGREILSLDIWEGDPDEDAQRANADLAREAPKLLGLLCRALPMLGQLRLPGPTMSGPWEPPNALIAEIRAAIKAATGGEM